MKNIVAIVLAAGEGTRMKSSLPKVLHQVCGKPMLAYILDALRQMAIRKIIVVVGHQAPKVKELLKNDREITTVIQAALLGSGDAVWQARSALSAFKGDVVVVYGDTPLVTHESLKNVIQSHQATGAACTLLAAVTKNPTGFGRIVRGDDNNVVQIVEEQEADTFQKAIGEINVGVYCYNARELFAALEQIKPDNKKNEYYLTDTIKILTAKKALVQAVSTADEQEALGINSRQELVHANAVLNKRNIDLLLKSGVTVVSPETTFVHADVEIGSDSVIYPHTIIESRVKIGQHCQIGPFARLRSGSVLEDDVQIGNFVEINRSKISSGTRIKHHSYIGDALIGKNVNVGAGTITANYDGKNKNQTIIEDGAFIGVGTVLIAPVKIGRGALTGAGSVVTKGKNVPPGTVVAGVPAKVLNPKGRTQHSLKLGSKKARGG